jgi:hypothetical protein
VEKAITKKCKSETLLSTNTTTYKGISTPKRTEQKSTPRSTAIIIVQTTPTRNNTKSARPQTSQMAYVSRPAAWVQCLTSKSRLNTEDTPTIQTDQTQVVMHNSNNASTKAGYISTEYYDKEDKEGSKDQATILNTSASQPIQSNITDAQNYSKQIQNYIHGPSWYIRMIMIMRQWKEWTKTSSKEGMEPTTRRVTQRIKQI